MKKVQFFFLFFLFATFKLSAQDQIMNSQNSSWQKVLPGELIAEPQETSYGYAFITDAKYLTCYSSNGNLLWDKPIKQARNPIFTVLPYDFFALITNSGKKFSLLNPNGTEIWSVKLEESITQKPYAGRDGRIFIRNTNSIYCYGINGIQKWKLETPNQTEIPIQELKDGSIVIFLSELVNGKSKGLRISPFGELLEEIYFSGEVYSTATCPQGILISFTNGLSGLFTLQEEKAKNKWTVSQKNSSNTNKDVFTVSSDKQNAVFISQKQNLIKINYLNLENGEIINSFDIPNIGTIKNCVYNNDGIFVTDNKKAYFYSHEGIQLFGGTFPQQTKNSNCNYYLYTQDNCLILFDTNWTANGFRTFQNVTINKNITTTLPKKDNNYNDFYNIDPQLFSAAYMPNKIDTDIANEKRLTELSEGNYGFKEQEWISKILSALALRKDDLIQSQNYTRTTEKSIFQKDYIGYQLLLKQISLYGTDTFIDYIAYLLLNDSDKTTIHTVLEGIPQNGYDPECKIINSIYHLSRKVSEKDDMTLLKICDAVYSLCLFNGKPAFYSKGREILTLFIYPKYSTKVRNYARDIFKKISELEL